MFLTLLTFLSAISISVIAAGYSIIGLATLFAGAVIPIWATQVLKGLPIKTYIW